MFGKQDTDRKVAESAFFLAADGADSDGDAADIALTILNRVIHVYESNGSTPAAYAITLPPVVECAGLIFSFTSVEDLSTYNVTIEDQDESTDWGDILMTGDGESLVLFSDGRKWHVLARVPYATTQAVTADVTLTPGVRSLTLDHTSVAIDVVIADAKQHQGWFVINVITEPTAGQDHVVTITTGTWDGSNQVITFADDADKLIVYFDATGRGTILLNTGGTLS